MGRRHNNGNTQCTQESVMYTTTAEQYPDGVPWVGLTLKFLKSAILYVKLMQNTACGTCGSSSGEILCRISVMQGRKDLTVFPRSKIYKTDYCFALFKAAHLGLVSPPIHCRVWWAVVTDSWVSALPSPLPNTTSNFVALGLTIWIWNKWNKKPVASHSVIDRRRRDQRRPQMWRRCIRP